MNQTTIQRLAICALLIISVSAGAALADTSAMNPAVFAPVVLDIGLPTPVPSPTAGPAPTCTTVVQAGQSIQAAVNAATSGQVICVRDGIYHEQVKITPAQAGIVLMAYPGEKPIVDGQGNLPPITATNKYMGLIHITGSNVIFDGFEVRNSAVRGIAVVQLRAASQAIHNVTVRNNIVHSSQDSGINVNGHETLQPINILIENNNVHHNLLKNAGGDVGGAGLTFIETNNSIARGNMIHHNLGGGLTSGRWTANITLEDNISFDNLNANIYVLNTQNPLVQRNFVFCTDDRAYWSHTVPDVPSPGIMLRDEDFETLPTSPPPSSGQKIINNIVVGCGVNFGVSTQIPGGGLNNAIVANNTLVNARGDAGASINNVLFAGDANYSNSKFVNNLILQSVPGNVANILESLGNPNFSTFTMSDNLYSNEPEPGWPVNEPGGMIVNPLLINPVIPVMGAFPDVHGYRLQASSPAINAGAAVNEVTIDFFKQLRTAPLDIGADELNN